MIYYHDLQASELSRARSFLLSDNGDLSKRARCKSGGDHSSTRGRVDSEFDPSVEEIADLSRRAGKLSTRARVPE